MFSDPYRGGEGKFVIVQKNKFIQIPTEGIHEGILKAFEDSYQQMLLSMFSYYFALIVYFIALN